MKVYGPGVEKTGLKANEPTYFTVDSSEAGQGNVPNTTVTYIYSFYNNTNAVVGICCQVAF